MLRRKRYKVGPQQQLFNVLLFSKWLAHGVLHGTMAYLIPFTAPRHV